MEYCGGDLKTVTCKIQKEMLTNALASCEETQSSEMQVQQKSKRGMIQVFLEQIFKLNTREEAIKLTEILLKRYKGNLYKRHIERKVTNKQLPKENKVLKRGLFTLYNRFCVNKMLKYSK